jgi:hypothetical protein
MKKLSLLILAMMFAFMKPVHAQVVVAGSAAPITAAFIGGMAAFALMPAVIVELQPYHVWNHVFPVVEESYPGDKHVPVQNVSYQVPNSAKYTYEDETGVHYVH